MAGTTSGTGGGDISAVLITSQSDRFVLRVLNILIKATASPCGCVGTRGWVQAPREVWN